MLEVVDEPLLPQAAASRAAQAATALRAIVLLALNFNETTSFVGLTVCTKGTLRIRPYWGRRTAVMSG